MAKTNIIRITESDLQMIVAESVKKVLKESHELVDWKNYVTQIDAIISEHASEFRRITDIVEDSLFDGENKTYYEFNQKLENLYDKIAYEINNTTRQKLVSVNKEFDDYFFISNSYGDDAFGQLLYSALYNGISLKDAYRQKRNSEETKQNTQNKKMMLNKMTHILKYQPKWI